MRKQKSEKEQKYFGKVEKTQEMQFKVMKEKAFGYVAKEDRSKPVIKYLKKEAEEEESKEEAQVV